MKTKRRSKPAARRPVAKRQKSLPSRVPSTTSEARPESSSESQPIDEDQRPPA